MSTEKSREILIWRPCDPSMPIAGGYLQLADLAQRVDELDELVRLRKDRLDRLGIRLERDQNRRHDGARVGQILWLSARASFHADEARWLLEESQRLNFKRGWRVVVLKAELEYWRCVACVNNALQLSHAFDVNERRLGRYRGGDTLATEKARRSDRIIRIAKALIESGSPRRGLAKRVSLEWKEHGWKRGDGKAPSERTINDHLKSLGL